MSGRIRWGYTAGWIPQGSSGCNGFGGNIFIVFQAVKGTVRQVVFGGECIPVFVGVLQCLPKRPVVNQTCYFPSVISCIINLIRSLKYLFITNTMRKEGEIMRYRQIFLAVSAMDSMADGMRLQWRGHRWAGSLWRRQRSINRKRSI